MRPDACAADNNIRVIEVSGTGEARTTPDVANLSLQVETHAATAEETSSKNAALAQKVVNALKDKLAGKGTVVTGDYSLNPEYRENNQPQQKPVITGYTAQNTITVETTELTLLGSLIDGAISSGANRINYLNFGLRDDTKAREEAIASCLERCAGAGASTRRVAECETEACHAARRRFQSVAPSCRWQR